MQGRGVLVQQTEFFISENPTDIIFTRNTAASDGAGGTTTTPTTLSPQTVRVIQGGPTAASVERQNESGEVERPDWVVCAMPDADIQRGDTFQYMGMNAEVIWVRVLPYELLADVAVR